MSFRTCPSSSRAWDVGRTTKSRAWDVGRNHQLDASPLGFLGDVLHHGKRPVGSASDDQTPAAPGDVLGQGQWGMAAPRPKRLRGSFPALTDPSPIDHEVVLVGLPVDPDRSECEPSESHVSMNCRQGIAAKPEGSDRGAPAGHVQGAVEGSEGKGVEDVRIGTELMHHLARRWVDRCLHRPGQLDIVGEKVPEGLVDMKISSETSGRTSPMAGATRTPSTTTGRDRTGA